MIGERRERLEDARFLTGRSRYVADLDQAGALHAFVIRSIHAHARLISVDASEARALPNVLVFRPDDFPADLMPIPMRIPTHGTLEPFLQRPIAREIVRFVGEAIAVVLAPSRALAEDAAELVAVSYAPLEPLVDPFRAMREDRIRIHEAGNIAAHWTTGIGDVDSALRNAAIVVEDNFRIQRHSAIPMETRGLIASFDPSRNALTVHGATKVPHVNRAILARMLDLPEQSVRMVEPDVGGSFGARGEFYPEDYLIPYCAMRTGRKVVWIEDRFEHFAALNHSREQAWSLKIAADADGRVLGIDTKLLNDMGAYVRTHGTVVASHSSAFFLGPYKVPNYRCEVTCVLTNRTPTATYRAPGMFEANFVRERAMDMLAAKMGLAPDEIRRRNLIPPSDMPYTVGTVSVGRPTVFDSGDFQAIFKAALDKFGWANGPIGAKTDDRKRGLGMATIVEPSGLGPFEGARVLVEPSGSVEIATGATSQGQGHETTLAQVCSEILTIPVERILVRHGDTALIPFGSGTYASRAAVIAGNAVRIAAEAVLAKAKEAAATLLQADIGGLEAREGAIVVTADPSRKVGFAELARALAPGSRALLDYPTEAQIQDFEGLSATRYMRAVPAGTAVFAVHLVQVAVDSETGQVQVERALIAADVGRAINPTIVEGQLIGGFVQGLGGALFEELVHDENGQLLTGSFADYIMPGVSEVPVMEALVIENARSPGNDLGVKGVGEIGPSGAGAAIANAVASALGSGGQRLNTLPLTPERVLSLTEPEAAR
jgi:carbon-monoxide dehydrogenase large subunit